MTPYRFHGRFPAEFEVLLHPRWFLLYFGFRYVNSELRRFSGRKLNEQLRRGEIPAPESPWRRLLKAAEESPPAKSKKGDRRWST